MEIKLEINDINDVPELMINNFLIESVKLISFHWETDTDTRNRYKKFRVIYFDKETEKTIEIKSIV